MPLGHLKAITDVCIIVDDIEKTVAFYTEKLDFQLRRRAEGFADFKGPDNGPGEGPNTGPSITLAAWERDHISLHTGVSKLRAPTGAHKACIAVELETTDLVDGLYDELTKRGVVFQRPPENYIWNARCAYFTDPDGTLWELYAWLSGGPDDYHKTP